MGRRLTYVHRLTSLGSLHSARSTRLHAVQSGRPHDGLGYDELAA